MFSVEFFQQTYRAGHTIKQNSSDFVKLIGTVTLTVLLPQAATVVREAEADDWMYRRSYFSHSIPPKLQAEYPQPDSRSAYRRAVPGAGFCFSVRGNYRFNRIFLNSGNSSDLTIIRESSLRFRP